MSNVVVIAPNARSVTIKVTPGDYLTDVLTKACTRLNLPQDRYIFKHKTRPVDLSIPFRTAGLPPGAKLELVLKSTTPSAVSVALQLPPSEIPPDAALPDGGRLVEKFPSNWTVWKVLRQFESGEASKKVGLNLNLTARGVAQTSAGGSGSGQLYYEVPVLNIMGRELASFADFQKTLSQLGYNSGRVLIRILFKKTDQTLFEAMEEINKFFQEEETAAREDGTEKQAEVVAKKEPDTAADAPPPEAEKAPEEPQGLIAETQSEVPTPMDTDEPSAEPTHAPSTLVAPPQPTPPPSNEPASTIERVAIFSPSTSSTIAAAQTKDPDSAFTPSIAHAQLHQARLLASSQNKRLLSDQELEAQAEQEKAKLASIKSVVIKVRFPDNWSADWKCSPDATGAHLYSAVREVMAAEALPFRLVLPGRVLLRDAGSISQDSLITAYKLSGRVLVSLVWDDSVSGNVRQQPFLKQELRGDAQQIVVHEIPQSGGPEEKQPEPSKQVKKETRDESGGMKMPKWMKLGKK